MTAPDKPLHEQLAEFTDEHPVGLGPWALRALELLREAVAALVAHEQREKDVREVIVRAGWANGPEPILSVLTKQAEALRIAEAGAKRANEMSKLPAPLTSEARVEWMRYMTAHPKESVPMPTFAFLMGAFIAHESDAAVGRLVRQKLTSWNDVPVERCTVTARELEELAPK